MFSRRSLSWIHERESYNAAFDGRSGPWLLESEICWRITRGIIVARYWSANRVCSGKAYFESQAYMQLTLSRTLPHLASNEFGYSLHIFCASRCGNKSKDVYRTLFTVIN